MESKLRPLVTCAPGETRGTYEREARGRFIAARRALGLSQLGAAARLEVDRSTVEDWERGAARVPAWALLAVEQRRTGT